MTVMPGISLARCVALVAALTLVGCGPASGPAGVVPTEAPTTSTPSPTVSAAVSPSAAPSTTPLATMRTARITTILDEQWAAIVRTGSWRPGCPVGRAGLRWVEVDHRGFDGRRHRGVLVVNADVAASVVRIFDRLYRAGFPIHRMQPIEEYAGDDEASMAADNTSAFNCRRPDQGNAPLSDSPHANGRAVDLNPYENPWIDWRCRCWSPSASWGTRRVGTGVITAAGPVVAAFRAEGWIWRGTGRAPDLQHFDTGYPSRRYRR